MRLLVKNHSSEAMKTDQHLKQIWQDSNKDALLQTLMTFMPKLFSVYESVGLTGMN